MKWILIGFVQLFLLFSQGNWISYTDQENTFTILAPGAMQTKEKMIETSTGDYLLNTVFLESNIEETENYLYMINYHEVGDDLYHTDSLNLNLDFLTTMAEDITMNMGGKLLYTNPVSDDKWTSMEYRVSFKDEKYSMKGKLILNNTHLFSLQVYSTKQYALNKNMDRFLQSFRLLSF